MPTLYDRDFYEWTRETAALVRAAEFNILDTAHLAEEIRRHGQSR